MPKPLLLKVSYTYDRFALARCIRLQFPESGKAKHERESGCYRKLAQNDEISKCFDTIRGCRFDNLHGKSKMDICDFSPVELEKIA